jgi:hypothetical protein
MNVNIIHVEEQAMNVLTMMEVSAAIVNLDIDCLTLQHVMVNKIVYFHPIKI